MAQEDPTEQVAPASDPADAGAAQAEQAPPSQGQAAEANGETAPAPDLQAELEAAKSELTKEKTVREAAEKRALDSDNLVKTQAGVQSATDRRLNQLSREVQRLTEFVKTGLVNPDGIANVEASHRKEDEQDFDSFTAEQRRGILSALTAAGFAENDVNDEELSDARALWATGFRANQRADIEQAAKSAGRAIKRMAAAKSAAIPAASPKPAVPESNGTARRIPNMDTGPGISAGAESLQALVNRVATGKPVTDAEFARAQDAMDNKGIYPD